MGLLEELFDAKILAVIRLFMDHKSHEFYLREISQKSGVPVSTIFRIVNKLVSLNLVEVMKVSKFKAYKWPNNEKTRFLEQMIRKEV
ncbi:helix-turn-helix domain-containing protein [Candidatus Woesearchaeota archaeon]|nr:helix-turn-helix domain-containing protein [Candidatus Woesearchaeota archaeon]